MKYEAVFNRRHKTKTNIITSNSHNGTQIIGGFRGGGEGGGGGGGGGGRAPPPPSPSSFKTFLYDLNPFNRPKNRFIRCFLILSSETLTLLNFASRIRSQCCMLHLLKSEVSFRGGREGGLGPLFLNFLDPPLQTIQ